MSFPYTYKGKTELLGDKIKGVKPDVFLMSNIIYRKIRDHDFQNISQNMSTLKFSSHATLFKYEYDVKLSIEKDNNDINIFYEIDVSKLINITLFIIILFAFFSFVSLKLFLIFSAVFSILFYLVNISILNNQTKGFIEKAIGENYYKFNEKEELSEEQLMWMNDNSRCSACGENISIFDLDCPDCGLKIKKGRKFLPVDTSKHKNLNIKYHYRQME